MFTKFTSKQQTINLMTRIVFKQSTCVWSKIPLLLRVERDSVVLDKFLFQDLWHRSDNKLHFFLSYEAGFYKPIVLKVHLPICSNVRLKYGRYDGNLIDPNEWDMLTVYLALVGFEIRTHYLSVVSWSSLNLNLESWSLS